MIKESVYIMFASMPLSCVISATIYDFPACKVTYKKWIGDGVCDDGIYNTEKCGYDGGDCVALGYPNCNIIDRNTVGTGTCDKRYNTKECGYDGGDCAVEGFPDCHTDRPGYINDGICDKRNDRKECGYDGGDCVIPSNNSDTSTSPLSRLSLFEIILLFMIAAMFVIFPLYMFSKTILSYLPACVPSMSPRIVDEYTQSERKNRMKRRLFVMNRIICKDVLSESSKDIKDESSKDHEKIISKDLSNSDKSSILENSFEKSKVENEVENSQFSKFHDDPDEELGITTHRKESIYVKSLNDSLNTPSDENNQTNLDVDKSTLYSPKSCPICLQAYKKDEKISWSRNKECSHAFHLDCIVQWLIVHDKCPLCRENYLDLKNKL
mmetsp:Transcript_23489/g.53596  ORF Transcript_23489/g.53596 Transcript_23489/m.53596 type:complete len:381 (-) Transcript_23489:25-1167(-)